MGKLKLVSQAGVRVYQKRPINTYYSGGGRPACSCTVEHAVVSAAKRVLLGHYTAAQVFDARGRKVAEVQKYKWAVEVRYIRRS